MKTGFPSKNSKIKPGKSYKAFNKLFKKSEKPGVLQDFSEKYLLAREKEGRIYTDEALRKLPDVGHQHRYFNEWEVRGRSAKLLKKYLETDNLPKNILELGCGNGWLSNFLAEIPGTEVWGMDVNAQELEQAARVFRDKENLFFIEADIFDSPFPEKSFDFIILASVIQYFEELPKLLNQLLPLLKENGEIHIIDSPFYKPNETGLARNRSKAYYQKLGVPEMGKNYFHHSIEESLALFNFEVLSAPESSLFSKIKKAVLSSSSTAFPWIKIKR